MASIHQKGQEYVKQRSCHRPETKNILQLHEGGSLDRILHQEKNLSGKFDEIQVRCVDSLIVLQYRFPSFYLKSSWKKNLFNKKIETHC